MIFLPRTFDVRSDGTVGVKTMLLTFKFKDVARAYQAGIFSIEEFLRPKFNFATSFSEAHTVVVRQRNGKWDVTCSPADTEEFIAALEKVTSVLELERSESSDCEETGLKTDLSTL
jgi:hypothetical protein